jgi:hypothetical protein
MSAGADSAPASSRIGDGEAQACSIRATGVASVGYVTPVRACESP